MAFGRHDSALKTYLKRGFGVHSADIISAVEFDRDGTHLATGDRGGRVVLFERVTPQPVSPLTQDVHTDSRNKLTSIHLTAY